MKLELENYGSVPPLELNKFRNDARTQLAWYILNSRCFFLRFMCSFDVNLIGLFLILLLKMFVYSVSACGTL